MNDSLLNLNKSEGVMFYGEDGLNQMLDEIQKEIDGTKMEFFDCVRLWITHIWIRHNPRTDSYSYLTYDSITNPLVDYHVQRRKEAMPYIECIVIEV